MASHYIARTIKYHPEDVLEWRISASTLYDELMDRAFESVDIELQEAPGLTLEIEYKDGFYYVYFVVANLTGA